MTEISTTAAELALPGTDAEALLRDIAQWGPVATIVLHGGSVFEFKGDFPRGTVAEGYYNLKGESGFEGHLGLKAVNRISFQDKQHRGRASYAFCFEGGDGKNIFKIFLGRDQQGEIFADQLASFKRIREALAV